MNIKSNPKLLFWGSFFGAIAVVAIVAGALYMNGQGKFVDLEKKFADWKTVNGKIMQFQARFPQEPEYESQDVPLNDSGQTMRQEIFVGSDENISYFVSATLYPSEISGDAEENLRKGLDGVVKAIPDAELITSKYTVPFLGDNYLEYKIHSAENDISLKGRMYLAAKILYQVYITYNELAYDDDKFTFFVNSFEAAK